MFKTLNAFLASDKVHAAIEIIVFGAFIVLASVPFAIAFAITI